MSRMNITTKLALVFILFGTVLLLGLALPIYINFRSTLQNTTNTELLATAIEKQAALNYWVDERILDIETIPSHPHLIAEIEDLADNQSGSGFASLRHDHILDSLMMHIGSGKQFEEIMLLAPESGQVILSTNPAAEGVFLENRPFFINGKHSTFVQTLYYSVLKQAPAMTISTPIRSANDRLLVVMAARMHLAEMDAIINRRTGLRQSDDSYLINTSGLFVTQPRLLAEPAVLQLGIHTPAIEHCLQHNSGVANLDDYHGIPVVSVYRWLPSQKLCLIVEIDQAEAFAPVRRLGTTMALSGGLVFMVGSIAAFFIAKTFTRPIQQLVVGAEEMGKGNLAYQIEINSKDEIGQLTNEFNRMGSSLFIAETKLQQRAELLETANKELEAFSYSISHDLRTPLRAMSGFSRILIDEHGQQLTKDVKGYLHKILRNTQQMSNLIDDLLLFSRMGRQVINMQKVSCEDIIIKALEELENEQAGRKIRLVVGKLPMCQADPVLIKQVFVNLLSNALKFTAKKKIAKIAVGFEKINKEAVYFVKDNGVGFDMRYVDKLFGVFQRLHSSADFEGTGVGLAIVQRIIQRHGGRVWAEAEVDKGAVFYFTLGGSDG